MKLAQASSLFRIFLPLLIVFFNPHAFASDAPARQAKILVIDGEAQICSKKQSTSDKCKAIIGDATSINTTSVVQAKFFKNARASWLATTPSGYYLCAVAKNTRTSKCTKLPIPRLFSAKITYQEFTTNRSGALRIAFSRPSSVDNRKAYAAILKSFANSISVARSKLRPWVDYNAAQPSRLGDIDVETAPVSSARFFENDEEPPEELPPVRVEGTVERVEYSFEYDPNRPTEPDVESLMPEPLSDAVEAAGVDEGCAKDCYTDYDKEDAPVCRKIPDARLRAICWATIAAKLGACLARC